MTLFMFGNIPKKAEKLALIVKKAQRKYLSNPSHISLQWFLARGSKNKIFFGICKE
jgi:hypothetical protein